MKDQTVSVMAFVAHFSFFVEQNNLGKAQNDK